MSTLTQQIAQRVASRSLAAHGERVMLDYPDLYILDKTRALIPLHLNTIQQDLSQHLTGRDLVLKARQFGITTYIQARFSLDAWTRTATTLTLCHEDELTQKIRRMVDRFYNNLPEEKRPARKYANATVNTYPDLDSEVTIVTVGGSTGKKKGRGDTYSHIHGSEVAFWPDAENVMAGALQAGNPQIILESTPNGAQGYFYMLCMEALDGSPDWKLHFYPWWSSGEYQTPLLEGEAIDFTPEEQALVQAHHLTREQIKWRRAKQRELKHLFIQEYPEDPYSCFLLSGNGYFGDLTHAYSAPLNPTYQADHRYYAGLDFGQTIDYTVCSVIDATTKQQVDLLRIHRLPWGEMRRQIWAMCQKWHVHTLQCEENSMGSTNIEELQKEFRSHHLNTHIVSFKTTNQSKAGIMGSLHEALHEGGLRLQPHVEQKREMIAFQSKQTITGIWQLAASPGEHDDIVIANALAWALVGRPERRYVQRI